MSYQCPLCHTPLGQQNNFWRCINNHQFDCAKEGYVNLMPVQHKHSKQPGDSTEMMQARRAFLDAGHYQPLQHEVAAILDRVLPVTAENLLDIGCGEGYYTAAVADRLQKARPVQVFGLDVAKVAIRYAARRYQQINFCVASSHRLPFADHSLDAVLRIYAPCKAQELARTVKPLGYLLTVAPAPRHLFQLKQEIYQEVQLHPEADEQLEGFNVIETQTLSYEMQLTGLQALDLLQMTPFAWRASEATRQRLGEMSEFRCETDFAIRLHQRQPD